MKLGTGSSFLTEPSFSTYFVFFRHLRCVYALYITQLPIDRTELTFGWLTHGPTELFHLLQVQLVDSESCFSAGLL